MLIVLHVIQNITCEVWWYWSLVSDAWSVSLCVQQVEDELSSPVVLFKFSQEMSAGKGCTPWTLQTDWASLVKSLCQSETVKVNIYILCRGQLIIGLAVSDPIFSIFQIFWMFFWMWLTIKLNHYIQLKIKKHSILFYSYFSCNFPFSYVSIQWGFSGRLLCWGERGAWCLQQMGECFPTLTCTVPCTCVPMLVKVAMINIFYMDDYCV